MPIASEAASRPSAAAECVARRRAKRWRGSTGCFLDSYIALLSAVGHRLDPVAVGIEDERRIVIRRVLRTEPRRAVVAPAARERRAVKCIHRCAARRREREVKAGAGHCDLARAYLDGKLVAAAGRPVSDRRRVRPDAYAAQRSERRVIARRRAGEIADREGEVMQHLAHDPARARSAASFEVITAWISNSARSLQLRIHWSSSAQSAVSITWWQRAGSGVPQLET